MDSPSKPISFVDHLDPPDQPFSEVPSRWRPGERGPSVRGPQGPTAEMREQVERDRKLKRAIEDEKKRAWIEAGNELRQPPEYRGRVFEHVDHDGVHPTAFPPLRWGPQEGLSDEYIAFQDWNQTRYETHPDSYCVACTIRYNARPGGKCGPCIGAEAKAKEAKALPLFDDVPLQISLPEYPD